MQHFFRPIMLIRFFLIASSLLCVASDCLAQVIYVDNVQGSDDADGLSDEAINAQTGPVRTISRALQKVKQGGAIIIANTGNVYYESLQLVGKNGSGVPSRPLRIIGNGAIIDGSKPVPPTAWRQKKIDLWSFRPRRKGHYQLLLNGELASEFIVPSTATKLPEIPRYKWAAWKGEIYYRGDVGDLISKKDFRFAYHSVGLSLYNVHDVRVEDLTFRYFQLDGINAHSLCRNLKFKKINSLGNGRAGFFIGGTTDVAIAESDLRNNRKVSLLIRGLAGAHLQKTDIDGKPQFIK